MHQSMPGSISFFAVPMSDTTDYIVQSSSANAIAGHAGPVLVSSTHANGATGIQVTDTRIVLTFSEEIAVDRYAIVVTDARGYMLRQEYSAVNSGAHAVGNQLVIKTEGFYTPGTYTIELPGMAVTDRVGNGHLGPERITFSTVQAVANGTAGNDLLAGGKGAKLDGGAGLDVAQYAGYWGEYTIMRLPDGVTVRHSQSGATDTLAGVERLVFQERAIALDIDGNAGQAYRLYRAAFDREPDQAGVGYWISALDHGASMTDISAAFLRSEEFQDLYGTGLSNTELVGEMYHNILHRDPDQGGFDYWVGRLDEGMAREKLLYSLSESTENVAAVAELVAHGFTYTPY